MFCLDDNPISTQKRDICDRLLSGTAEAIYVLGRNKYAERVSRVLPVHAFIDDFTSEKIYLDRPVVRMTDLPDRCLVISCVVDTVPITAWDRLQSVGVTAAIDYFALSRLAPDKFMPVEHCAAGDRRDILDNRAQYEQVYNLLADEVSKRHFAQVVQFRLTMDVEHMRGLVLALDRQYFEDFVPMQAGDVFVDGGGYDGQTALQFVARNGAYRKIHYFEPVPAMMDVSRQAMASLRDVCFIQKGLFSRNDRLRFDVDGGPAAGLSPTGRTEIDVVRLDDEVADPVTFMKLDIEGAEYDAIQGAMEHIVAETPVLAVCVYHNQRDFWRIPLQILKNKDHYDVFFRHYSESIRETVMFFIPKNRCEFIGVGRGNHD